MAELIQQVKNSLVTTQNMSSSFLRRKDLGQTQTQTAGKHATALQDFSNGAGIPYNYTLRVVTHESDSGGVMTDTRKAPGYIRNELGGMFTS
mmetsp:Transcript_40125/g.55746  ORF Transcript_40125/g.55746 Transcript_40125/m.55746 type:complete len:92 (-) Transcript_40125:155-430(-)|eukprot:CAMPEP_0196579546 /NCGR_PEP_ID=MMETSP1081-20130531/22604_1 /TAXON_ID=36882 /ORGANISM="Pyramimonas amylifera, Strain CCMP720" /LENGTH=91 /DNA_ID=CAMNT_0041899169 /DNA_START=77 /DNA_END=352 /DNA_ORIENTATION=+